ncbi:MAG: hypothetical protein M1823_001985 [Watsoniomyces obsoletus]|nr:MAG: hypothetical protein M1823_001985 [Watsoniomyces obsoletus]
MASADSKSPALSTGKRKYTDEDTDADSKSKSATTSPEAQGPQDGSKKARIIGPTLPPGFAQAQSDDDGSASDGSSSSEDDLGPALPTAAESRGREKHHERLSEEVTKQEEKVTREQWMLEPPKSSDWTSRVDPTKLRNRKFNTGMGAKAPAQKSGGDSMLWTETPEQKRQRLADEVMGIKKPATAVEPDRSAGRPAEKDHATSKRIQEYNDRFRNQSLYSERKAKPKEEEDDPSKRAFDKEKDIRGSGQINHTKRKELLNRAADFGSRFSGGSYL